MGLDMYLSAQRRLPEGFPLTTDELRQVQDEDDGGTAYLGMWDWYGDEAKLRCREVLEAVGLADVLTDGSPSCEIRWLDNENRFAVDAKIGYWRKANQIHAWFVEHVQGDIDECQRAEVSRDQLTQLRDTCRTVLAGTELHDGLVNNGWTTQGADPEIDLGCGPGWRPILEEGQMVVETALAEELLPTQSGFFFGSTDYDQWYVRDLEDTVKIIHVALGLSEDVTFYYQSSW